MDLCHVKRPEQPNYCLAISSDLVILVNLVRNTFFVEIMKVRRKFVKVNFELDGFKLKVVLIFGLCFYFLPNTGYLQEYFCMSLHYKVYKHKRLQFTEIQWHLKKF